MPLKESGDIRPAPATLENPFQKHRAIYWVIFLLVGAAGTLVLLFANYEYSKEEISYANDVPAASAKSKPVRIQIEFTDAKRAFEGPAGPGMNVAGALSLVSRIAGLELKIQQDKIALLGDAQSGDAGHAWELYINGVKVRNALSQLVADGDRILVRYE